MRPVDELEALRELLEFDTINVVGQSWGGSLALEYSLKYPERVNKLILHSPLIDTKLWVKEAEKLKDQLPDNLGSRMRQLEQSGDTSGKEYKKLSHLFNDTFVLRVKPKPQDAIDGLPGIKQKTLLISGKYDEATPRQMEIVKNKVPDIRWELFDNSSHCANLEEPEKFMKVVSEFLKSK